MSKENILAFAKKLASRIYEVGWYSLDEAVIRTYDITISLDHLVRLAEAELEGGAEDYKKHFKYPEGWCESENRLEDIAPRVVEDEGIEAVIFCEGDLWETLYYCEAYGSADERKQAIYKGFVQSVAEYGMFYEWGSGTIYLYEKN